MLQPNFDPSELGSRERRERLPGAEEKRELSRTWRVASGTFACPTCDLPVAFPGTLSLGVVLGCPYCDHEAPARDFLSLTDAPRPARVHVTATIGGSGFGVERREGDRPHPGGGAGEGHHERSPAQR